MQNFLFLGFIAKFIEISAITSFMVSFIRKQTKGRKMKSYSLALLPSLSLSKLIILYLLHNDKVNLPSS